MTDSPSDKVGTGVSSKGNDKASPKEALGRGAERWFARNRSLVLRQTPFWAQSVAGLVIALGFTGITAGILFRIDEVVTVTGQLESINGKVDVKAPVGGKVAEVLFKDGTMVEKGKPLVRFDTRQAQTNAATSKKLIELETTDLEDRLKILEGREDVLKKKLVTNESITNELSKLVSAGGFQRIQYLQQLDELYALRTDLANIKLEESNNIRSRKSIED